MSIVSSRLGPCLARAPRISRSWDASRWTRWLHTRRELPYPIEGGLGDFLPPAALRVVAVDYQQGLLDKLNDEVKNIAHLRDQSVANTVMITAPDHTQTLAFAYASLALNNSFFLDHLKPPPPPPATNFDEMPPRLRQRINDQYGSVEQLVSTFNAAAIGMFSSGFTWLAVDMKGHMAVINTFGPGTLLVRSRRSKMPIEGPVLNEKARRATQDKDVATPRDSGDGGSLFTSRPQSPLFKTDAPPTTATTSPTSGLSHSSALPTPPPHTRQLNTFPDDENLPYLPPPNIFTQDDDSIPTTLSEEVGKKDLNDLGEEIGPLFCISVHEHAWMSAGYGVWGKEEYLKRFWSVLDWKKVGAAYNKWVMMDEQDLRGRPAYKSASSIY